MTQETAHMPLDERALEAAVLAHDKEEAAMRGEPDPWRDDRPEQEFSDRIFAMNLAIRAYLQTAAADVRGLVRSIDQWRRKMVPVAVTAGSPAQIEYALADAKHDIIALWATLQALSASNAALEAENERLREALGGMLVPFEGDECRRDHHGYCQTHFLEEDCCFTIARAALSAPKGGQDD